MKKKLIKFLVIPLSVMIISLFAIPSFLFAGPDDDMVDAMDAPSGAEGDLTATDSDQGDTFSSFGNIDPTKGDDFTALSTGDVQDNEDGTSGSTAFGGSQDFAELELSVTAPSRAFGFTFDFYYMTNENSTSYDLFFTSLDGSSDVADGTVIAYADYSDTSPQGGDLDGTAFEFNTATGWMEGGGPVDPGDDLSVFFIISDTIDNGVDSAVILDNFQFLRKAKPWVRTMPLTCWQVWVNEENMFEMVFLYPYANDNWVRIYDMDDNLVFEINVPLNDPHIVVDLPDGMYTVMTFHAAGKIIQEFVIGKP